MHLLIYLKEDVNLTPLTSSYRAIRKQFSMQTNYQKYSLIKIEHRTLHS